MLDHDTAEAAGLVHAQGVKTLRELSKLLLQLELATPYAARPAKATNLENAAALISALLIRVGEKKKGHQARLVAERLDQWSRYVHGHKSPRLSVVLGWLQSLDSAGYTMRLTIEADGIKVELVC